MGSTGIKGCRGSRGAGLQRGADGQGVQGCRESRGAA